jgi:peptidoglycan/LPS O-acetylase OafA/YrhL
MLLCVLITSVFIAHTTHRFVERPLREVGRRLADSVSSAGPVTRLRPPVRGGLPTQP